MLLPVTALQFSFCADYEFMACRGPSRAAAECLAHPAPTAPAVTAGTRVLAALDCVPVQGGLGIAPEILVVCLSSDHRVFFSALWS